MIQFGLSVRDRRTLATGVTVIGTLFGLARGAPALTEWTGKRTAEAATLSAQASTVHAGVRLLPLLRDSLRARQARLIALDSVMISGASASAASANLSSVLSDMADGASVRVTAMQLRADSVVGELAVVGVRVTGVADVIGLAAFLRAIEGGNTLLAVRELAVTQTEPTAATNAAEALRVDVLVEAVARMTAGKRP